ncbi:MAG: phosphohistidine phosphatase SixA [Pseudomonas sp.]
MRLWILRHGQAQAMAATDPQRELTPWGRREVLEVASQLKGAGLQAIVASPYVRAQQTAELVSERLEHARGIATAAWLTPDDDPRQVLDYLAERSESELLLVSHQPLVSQLIGLLVDGNRSAHYPMPTAGLACIDMDFPAAGLGHLQLLTSPAQLAL